MRIASFLLLASLVAPAPAAALTMQDPLAAWANAPAMERIELATRFGRSFASLNESFTRDYFLKCIDDISVYGGAKEARIEDAMRECVASQQRMKGGPPDDDE